jgi:hypothetical protein
MTRLARHHAVEGFGVGLKVSRSQPTNPTNGRQGKRPAIGAAHVVGKVEEFANVANTRCHTFLAKHQRYQ